MNLFKNMAERFRAPKADEPEEPTIVVAKPKPYITKSRVKVPVGFVMPLGSKVVTPFALTVEAGARWHDTWNEPRITVNIWRILPMGDAIGCSGMDGASMYQSLLDPNVVKLAEYHGQPVTPDSQALLDKMGLAAPDKPQELATFNSWRTP